MHSQNKKRNSNKVAQAKSVEVVKNGDQAVAIKGTVSATYTGPLPPPEMLKGFAEVYPESVKLIFDEFEKNSAHVRELEQSKLQSEVEIAKRGQWMAFVIGIFLFCLAGYAVFVGANWIAGGALFIAIAGIAKSISNSKNNKQ